MTTEKMTVHKALSELKIMDARITKQIDSSTFITTNKHCNDKINGIPVADYEKILVGNYDKCKDLIARCDAIKRAVTLSNAITKVKINDVEYTVAEAIYMKNHGIENKELMLGEMRSQFNKCMSAIAKYNGSDLDNRADAYITNLYGSKEKANSDEIKKTRDEFIKAQSYDLVNPINLLDVMNNLEAEIAAFKSEVDGALSTSNALTIIEVTY